MGPEEAIVWTVGVSFLVTVLVMMSVSRNPFHWTSLHSQNTTSGKKVFNPFRGVKTFVGELSVV